MKEPIKFTQREWEKQRSWLAEREACRQQLASQQTGIGKYVYPLALIAQLAMLLLIIAAWFFPQAFMTGAPRGVLLVMLLLVVAAIVGPLVMRKRW